jgi:hypothetical protein
VIDNFSAGCLVFADASDYDFFMRLAKIHRSMHGNRFTLTLIDFRDERRRTLSIAAWTSLIATSVAVVADSFINRKSYATI